MKSWKELEFDADEIIEGLRPWAECESPTWDPAAVDRMMDLIAMKCAELGATIERIPGMMGLGGFVRATFPYGGTMCSREFSSSTESRRPKRRSKSGSIVKISSQLHPTS